MRCWNKKGDIEESEPNEDILINNPYTGGQILVSPDVMVEISLARLLDIRSGKASHLMRSEYNYFRWLAGLDNFITKGERVNMNISEMWIYDQAGRLLRHLGYDNI